MKNNCGFGFTDEQIDELGCKIDYGKITNIDYQTNWIYKELQITNKLIKSQNELIEQQNNLTWYLIRLIEHMLEKSDNPEKMRESVKMEIARGIRGIRR